MLQRRHASPDAGWLQISVTEIGVAGVVPGVRRLIVHHLHPPSKLRYSSVMTTAPATDNHPIFIGAVRNGVSNQELLRRAERRLARAGGLDTATYWEAFAHYRRCLERVGR